MNEIIIASKNEGKIREIERIIDSDYTFFTYKDFNDWPDVEETGQTFAENALLKAKALSRKYSLPAIADDSGLVVEALNGQPGINSARYAGAEQNDFKNINKLLGQLKNAENRKAKFVTVAVFCGAAGVCLQAEGEVTGKIVSQMAGTGGFGYDPVFVPEGYDRTMAELSPEEKNAISHRGRAFRKLKEALRKNSCNS